MAYYKDVEVIQTFPRYGAIDGKGNACVIHVGPRTTNNTIKVVYALHAENSEEFYRSWHWLTPDVAVFDYIDSFTNTVLLDGSMSQELYWGMKHALKSRR